MVDDIRTEEGLGEEERHDGHRQPEGGTVAAVPEHYYEWSADNSVEVERGWIRTAPTLEALAARLPVPAETFQALIEVLKDDLSRPTLDEWWEEVRKLPPLKLRTPAADAIRAARREEGVED